MDDPPTTSAPGNDAHPVDTDLTDPARLRRDSLITSVAGLTISASAILTSPLTARALGRGGRGDYTAVVAPTQILMWIIGFGLPMASLFYGRVHPPRKLVMGAWVWGTAAGGVIAAVLWVLAPSYLHDHNPICVFWFRAFLLCAIPFVPCYVAIDLVLARRRIVLYNLLRLTPYLLNTVFVVLLWLLDDLDLRSALGAMLVAHLSWFVLVFVICNAWPGPGFDRRVFGEQLRYGARVSPGSLSEQVVARLDQLVLVGVVSSSALGVYAVAVNVAGVSQPIAYAITSSVFPRLRATRDASEGRRMNLLALRYAWVSSVGISVAIALATPIAVPLVYGSQFRPAVSLVWLLLPGQIVYNVAIVLAGRLQAVGRPGRASIGQLIGAAVTVVGLWLFIDRYGIKAAAVTTSVSQFVYLAYNWWSVRSAPHVEDAIEVEAGHSLPDAVAALSDGPPLAEL